MFLYILKTWNKEGILIEFHIITVTLLLKSWNISINIWKYFFKVFYVIQHQNHVVSMQCSGMSIKYFQRSIQKWYELFEKLYPKKNYFFFVFISIFSTQNIYFSKPIIWLKNYVAKHNCPFRRNGQTKIWYFW